MPENGTILDKSSIAQYLQRVNRTAEGYSTWGQMYGSVDLAGQRASASLGRNYDNAVIEAYTAANKARQNVASSNIGSGFKTQALQDIDASLNAAYDSYISNYMQGKSDIAESVAQGTSSITGALMGEATNTSNYIQAMLDYVPALFNQIEEGNVADVSNLPEWSRYLNYEYDEYGNLAKDEKGNYIRSLKPVSEIQNMLFDFDEFGRGTLNEIGTNFFDMIMNNQAMQGYTFGDYLKETDPDLWEWANAYNEYDAEYDSNKNYIRELLGMERDDYQYTTEDFVKGLSDEERAVYENTKYEEFMAKLDAALNSYEESISGMTYTGEEGIQLRKDLNNLAEEYGLDVTLVDTYMDNISKLREYKNIEQEIKNYENLISTAVAGGMAESLSTYYELKKDAENRLKAMGTKKSLQSAADKAKAKIINASGFTKMDTGNKTGSKFVNKDKSGNYIMETSTGSVTYVPNVELSKNTRIRDKTNDNFSVKIDGSTYHLEVAEGKLDTSLQSEIATYYKQAFGRELKQGDIFLYNGEIYVVTVDKKNGNAIASIRQVKQQGLSSSYKKLRDKFNLDIK